MEPDHEPHALLQFFSYEHLPPHLSKVSAPFAELAAKLLVLCPDNEMLDIALYTLIQAKDAAVRAVVMA